MLLAMDRSQWESTLTCFQASARGYLVRNEVRRAREDYEDIVKEVDGDLTHLGWSDAIIPTPKFTDTEGTFLRSSNLTSKPSNPVLDVCPSSQSPSAMAPSPQEGRHSGRAQKTEAERDNSLNEGQASRSEEHFSNSMVRGDEKGQKESTVVDEDGGTIESTGDSTTVWSDLEVDTHPDNSSQQYFLAKEVPCTPEALRLHRNTLTMELLWLQQAIDSRKKYLSLKHQLSVS